MVHVSVYSINQIYSIYEMMAIVKMHSHAIHTFITWMYFQWWTCILKVNQIVIDWPVIFINVKEQPFFLLLPILSLSLILIDLIIKFIFCSVHIKIWYSKIYVYEFIEKFCYEDYLIEIRMLKLNINITHCDVKVVVQKG